MKRFGLVGGVGPASTLDYYRLINEGYIARTGTGAASENNPPMVIDSLNLAVAYDLVNRQVWPEFTKLFVDSINLLEGAGAQFAAIAANTAHIVFDDIQKNVNIPVLSLIEETVKYTQQKGCKKAMIFGTGFTMKSGLYEAAYAKYGIEAFVPTPEEQAIIHGIIFPNLQANIVLPEEKEQMLAIAKRMMADYGCDCLVLGCTELPLMLKDGDLDLVMLDTTMIHIDAILDEIMK